MQDISNIQSLLKWYISAGVDETCSDEPVCFVTKAEPSFKQSPLLSQNTLASKQNARDISAKAQTLEQLREQALNFEGCALKTTAKSTVFGAGNPHAQIMFIGEAPGADEDRTGLPFVGRSGRLLEKMLSAIGLSREDVYITNVIMWRPPGNRTPTDSEVSVCLPFVKRQIELINPKIIVFLGASSANALLENTDSISKMRGHWFEYALPQNSIPAIATFHPAFLLRNCAQKAKSWSDFLRILKKLKEN